MNKHTNEELEQYDAFIDIVLQQIIPDDCDLANMCHGTTSLTRINTRNTSAACGSGRLFETYTAHLFYKEYSEGIYSALNYHSREQHAGGPFLMAMKHNRGECWNTEGALYAEQFLVVAAVELTIADIAKRIDEYIEWDVSGQQSSIPIEGNASAIDEETDYAVQDWIYDQLEMGNDYAWCDVRVTGTFNGNKYTASLGAVSCASEQEFNATHLDDLKKEVIAQIRGF